MRSAALTADPDARRAPVRALCLDPLGLQRGDDRALHRAQELDDRPELHDRIADQLPGPVVGQLAAAIDLDDLDSVVDER